MYERERRLIRDFGEDFFSFFFFFFRDDFGEDLEIEAIKEDWNLSASFRKITRNFQCSLPFLLYIFFEFFHFPVSISIVSPKNRRVVWYMYLNICFRFLNKITLIFIYFFNYTYFQKIQTTLPNGPKVFGMLYCYF